MPSTQPQRAAHLDGLDVASRRSSTQLPDALLVRCLAVPQCLEPLVQVATSEAKRHLIPADVHTCSACQLPQQRRLLLLLWRQLPAGMGWGVMR